MHERKRTRGRSRIRVVSLKEGGKKSNTVGLSRAPGITDSPAKRGQPMRITQQDEAFMQ